MYLVDRASDGVAAWWCGGAACSHSGGKGESDSAQYQYGRRFSRTIMGCRLAHAPAVAALPLHSHVHSIREIIAKHENIQMCFEKHSRCKQINHDDHKCPLGFRMLL